MAEVTVLEGELQLAPVQAGGSSPAVSQSLLAGQKAQLGADGTVPLVTAQTLEEVRQRLAGPLFQGFRTELSEQERWNRSLKRLDSDLSRAAPVEPGREPAG